MKTTLYFDRKRLERGLRLEWVLEAIDGEVERRLQDDGRITIWGWVGERNMFFRVILLPDGETILNAFPDSNYTRKRRRR